MYLLGRLPKGKNQFYKTFSLWENLPEQMGNLLAQVSSKSSLQNVRNVFRLPWRETAFRNREHLYIFQYSSYLFSQY